MEQYDVVIVGGGPSGVSAAIKMAELGFKVRIFERKSRDFYKPCGGVLTIACRDILRYELDVEIPEDLYSEPEMLGLELVSPSFKRRIVENYKLLNVDREKFNRFLLGEAEERGVGTTYNARFISCKLVEDGILSTFKIGMSHFKTVKSKYLIGADGVLSSVRRILYKRVEFKPTFIVQEWWEGRVSNPNFYMYFLHEDITPIYAYLIPKDGRVILGLGVPFEMKDKIIRCLSRFRSCLGGEVVLDKLVKREGWYIPGGLVMEGGGNVVLVGDAGGFCNPLTGEGVRFSIETGVAAAYSLEESIRLSKPFSEMYSKEVGEIKRFIEHVNNTLKDLKGEAREKLVEKEASRKIPIL